MVKPKPPVKKPDPRETKTPKNVVNRPLKGHADLFALKNRLEREARNG